MAPSITSLLAELQTSVRPRISSAKVRPILQEVLFEPTHLWISLPRSWGYYIIGPVRQPEANVDMKAIILSAGRGTRMRPLTYYLNKGLVPIGDRPLLEHILLKLKDQGIDDFIIAISHLHQQVEHYFRDGSRIGVRIAYSISDEPLGTAGEMVHMRDMLDGEESFLVHYGDILTNLDLPAMVDAHRADARRIATIGLVTNVPIHTGIATFAPGEDRLTHFEEKPLLQEPCHAAVNIFRPRALGFMRLGEDIAYHAIPRMLAAGERVCGFLDEKAYWRDVGRLSDLDEVNSIEDWRRELRLRR